MTHVLGEGVQVLFILKSDFNFTSIIDWFSLVTYTVGHSSWNHLLGNMMLILLVGPMLEEKYGSKKLLIMMVLTAIITAVSNIVFFNKIWKNGFIQTAKFYS